MNTTLLKLHLKFQALRDGEEGQDLIEYALLAALIALAATASMTALANDIEALFNAIGAKLTTATLP